MARAYATRSMRSLVMDTGVSGDHSNRAARWNLVGHVLAFHDFAENGVLVVQPRRRRHGEEELAAVGPGPALAMDSFPACECFSEG